MILPAAIEDMVREIVRDELAGVAGGGDGMSLEGGQQLAPDGTVTYDFDGRIHATGLDLDVQSARFSVGQDLRSITWLRRPAPTPPANDGWQAGALVGVDTGGEGEIDAMAIRDGGLSVMIRKLIDSAGRSDFAQLIASSALSVPGALAVEVLDTGTYAINGGAAVGAGGTWVDIYTHDLLRTPAIALPILTGSGTVIDNVLPVRINSRTASAIGLAYRFLNGASSAAGATARFFVLVIG